MLLYPCYQWMEPPHQGTFDCECYTCEHIRVSLYVSPEHEKMFSLLAVLLRVVPHARRLNTLHLRVLLTKMHAIVTREIYLDVGSWKHARISLRVRSAVEAIFDRLADQRDPYQAVEFVERAAKFGTRKSTLLTAVTDRTWQEQVAGRARLAIKRDWPELEQ